MIFGVTVVAFVFRAQTSATCGKKNKKNARAEHGAARFNYKF